MNQQSQYANQTLQGPQGPSLTAVKVSPLDERLASLGGNIALLESEIESLGKQLSPVTVSGLNGTADANAKCAAPAPIESSIEQAVRANDNRIAMLWQIVSALRAQLRV